MIEQKKDTKDKIKEKIATLPPGYQKVLSQSQWLTALTDIGKKYKLHFDQIDNLYIETFLVMLGLSDEDDYTNNLVEKLFIKEELAESLTKEINTSILLAIKEQLMKESANQEDDVVPLKTQLPSSTNSTEQSILQKTGVEFEGMGSGGAVKPENIVPPEPQMTRSQVMEGIEHPQKTPATFVAEPPHPLEQKLAEPASTVKAETEYQKQAKPDPYREIPL